MLDNQFYSFSKEDVQWAEDWLSRIEQVVPNNSYNISNAFLNLNYGKLIELLSYIATPNALLQRQKTEGINQTLGSISTLAIPNSKTKILDLKDNKENLDNFIEGVIKDVTNNPDYKKNKITETIEEKPLFDEWEEL